MVEVPLYRQVCLFSIVLPVKRSVPNQLSNPAPLVYRNPQLCPQCCKVCHMLLYPSERLSVPISTSSPLDRSVPHEIMFQLSDKVCHFASFDSMEGSIPNQLSDPVPLAYRNPQASTSPLKCTVDCYIPPRATVYRWLLHPSK